MRHRDAHGISWISRFWQDKSGGVMVYTALALPMLLGVTGLSVDVSAWYMSKRITQAAADAAALSGALSLHRLEDDSGLTTAATEGASANGYDSSDGDVLIINNPPTSGPYAGQANAVEAIIQRPANGFLSRVIFEDQVTVAARAVAVADTKNECVYGLSPTGTAVKASGGANVALPCGIMSNSTDPSSLTTNGGGCITATKIKTAGGASGNCINPGPATNMLPVSDPFVGMAPPSGFGGCDSNSNIRVNNRDEVTLDPGVYCGKITVNNGGTLNFEPGLYVLDGAGLDISGTVTGEDVTFYITEDSGQGDNISITSNADVTLSAPSDGEMPGVLFYQDRNSPSNINHNFTGQASVSLEGILYFPNQDLTFAGGSATDPVPAIIVANTVDFTGDTNTGDFDGSVVIENPFLIDVSLVE